MKKMQWINDNAIELLKEIKKLFNYYIYMVALRFLAWLIDSLKPEPKGTIEIFNLEIYPFYFSLVYGILFIVFIFLLFTRIRLLRKTIAKVDFGEDEEFSLQLKNFPWIASPIHELKVGYRIFRSIIAGGSLWLLWLSIAHILGRGYTQWQAKVTHGIYISIGWIDAVLLVGCIFLIVLIFKDISHIRRQTQR